MITATDTRKMARESLSGKWGKAALITFCYVLLEYAFSLLANLTENITILNIIFSIGLLLISVPLSYGLVVSFMKLKRNEQVQVFDFATIGFSSFSRAWKVSLSMIKKLILPIILLIASILSVFFGLVMLFMSNPNFPGGPGDNGNELLGILGIIFFYLGLIFIFVSCIVYYVKYLHYVLSYNIAYDEPEMSSKDVVLKSKSLMKGNRGNYFVLKLPLIVFEILLAFILYKGWAVLAIFTYIIGYFWLSPYITVATICFYDTLANKDDKNEIEQKDNTSEEI